MERHASFNHTNSTTPPQLLWDRIHAEILEYMMNRSAKEGRYWERNDDPAPTADSAGQLDSQPPDSLELESGWRTALICAFSFNIVLSVVGNTIVLIVLSFGRTKSDLNIFLINLALADLTIATFCMPFTFTTIMYGHWIFGGNMCPTVIFLQQVSVIVSIYTLTAIGIDRYFAVIYPLKVRVTKHRSKILLGVIFLVAVSLAVVQAVFARTRQSRRAGIYFCDEWPEQNRAFLAYEVFIVLTTYFLPLIVLLYTYTRIGVRLWGRRIPGNAHNFRDKSHMSSKKKVVKMLIVVVLMFALCWLPLHIFNLIAKFHPSFYDPTDHALQDKLRKINACVLWLAMSNSFMNPVIYSLLNDSFRTIPETVTQGTRFWNYCSTGQQFASVFQFPPCQADMPGVFRNCFKCKGKDSPSNAFLTRGSSRNRSASSTSTTHLTNSRFSVVITKFRRSSGSSGKTGANKADTQFKAEGDLSQQDSNNVVANKD